MLHNLQDLNALAGEDVADFVKSDDGNVIRLERKSPVPLKLYSNGFILFSGPFRPYTDGTAQVCFYVLYMEWALYPVSKVAGKQDENNFMQDQFPCSVNNQPSRKEKFMNFFFNPKNFEPLKPTISQFLHTDLHHMKNLDVYARSNGRLFSMGIERTLPYWSPFPC